MASLGKFINTTTPTIRIKYDENNILGS